MTSTAADFVTILLARDVVAAVRERGVRVFAVTSLTSLVAARAARRLGAPGLALASGFARLDAGPYPAVSLGELACEPDASPRSVAVETFVALARGRVGVVVSPAQIDARAATNLSRVGGTDARPAVALPGSRGLPDNNHSRSTVWYLLPDHTPRRLVAEVDFRSGAPPGPGRYRRLFSPLAVMDFVAGSGWQLTSVTPGTSVADVRAATGFELFIPVNVAESEGPTARELEVLAEVDVDGLRRLDFGGHGTAELAARRAEEEARVWASR